MRMLPAWARFLGQVAKLGRPLGNQRDRPEKKVQHMIQYLKNNEIATEDVITIRGCDITCRKFSKRQRGQLAIEVIEGRAMITDLSKKQLAGLFGLPPDYFRGILHGTRHRDGLLDTTLELDCFHEP